MEIEFFLDKSIEQNAAFYYEKAKHLKKKRPEVSASGRRPKERFGELQGRILYPPSIRYPACRSVSRTASSGT